MKQIFSCWYAWAISSTLDGKLSWIETHKHVSANFKVSEWIFPTHFRSDTDYRQTYTHSYQQNFTRATPCTCTTHLHTLDIKGFFRVVRATEILENQTLAFLYRSANLQSLVNPGIKCCLKHSWTQGRKWKISNNLATLQFLHVFRLSLEWTETTLYHQADNLLILPVISVYTEIPHKYKY